MRNETMISIFFGKKLPGDASGDFF